MSCNAVRLKISGLKLPLYTSVKTIPFQITAFFEENTEVTCPLSMRHITICLLHYDGPEAHLLRAFSQLLYVVSKWEISCTKSFVECSQNGVRVRDN